MKQTKETTPSVKDLKKEVIVLKEKEQTHIKGGSCKAIVVDDIAGL